MTDQSSMQDPTEQYGELDIPPQRQPEPGLDAKLEPKADHGEESYKGSGRLKGRKALITGADSGIGAAVAIAFAREGAAVCMNYLREEEADAARIAKYIEDAGVKCVKYPGDIKSEEFCRKLVGSAAKQLGGLDIVVNNAGKQVYNDDLAALPTVQLEHTFQTNVFAMFWITQEALKHLPKGAAIINTTSIQAYQPSPGLLDYAATKAAIANFTHGLAQQLAEKGIRVNAVAPGPIWTPLQPSYGQSPEKLTGFGSGAPLGRPGQPAELAPMYVFLASQESSYITGEVMGVTGGQHLP